MKISKKKKKESRHRLDDPANVKKLIRGLYWLCGLVIGIDIIFSLFWHKHAIFKEDDRLHTLETLPMFYGIYGFVAFVGLVYVSKLMRSWKGSNILMREEDYWNK